MKKQSKAVVSQKLIKKIIRVSFMGELLEWPPRCYTFDYQPLRPNKPILVHQERK